MLGVRWQTVPFGSCRKCLLAPTSPSDMRVSPCRDIRVRQQRMQQAAQQREENMKSWEPSKDPNVEVGGGHVQATD